MNDQGSLGSPSTSNSSNSNSSMSGMPPIMNHINSSNNMNNMNMMSNNNNNNMGRRGGGGGEPMIPMSHHNSGGGGSMPPSSYGYNPRGINTAGVELQLSNIDREIRGLQQQQEQLEMGGGPGGGGGMGGRSLTPDGHILNHIPRSLFTPTQLHTFKDQVRRYRMIVMWNPAAMSPPPSTPSPTITPPMIVPPAQLEPRIPARGRGSRGPRGSRGTPRTRTNRPRAPKPTATSPAPPPQLPPPYVRYPTPYIRYPRMGVGRPRYPPAQYMPNDMLEGGGGGPGGGVHDNMNMNSNNSHSPHPMHQSPHTPDHQQQQQHPHHQHQHHHHQNDDGLMRSSMGGGGGGSPSCCSYCASFVGDGSGISLQSCFHTFCRTCLAASIEQCEAPQIPCPLHHESQCRGYLMDSEIKSVVSEDVFQAYLSRSLSHTMKSDNSTTLNHCYGQDCNGVCAIDDGLKSFYCPLCHKLNCLTCETTHDSPCEASMKNNNKRPGSGPDESSPYPYDITMKRSRIESVNEAELRKDFETSWELCAKFNPESENNCNTNSSDPATGSE